ncbi:hypothetical protein OBBRIDRAFT_543779 [Obba rivulosa]|uniref:Uncharacterized protein n=1 Tax=Obba rivulosa TaxID=1052685 RepID=A0A8E2DMM8_9APHY|nr:hypothetical protein OBBRIDRAFT_543779 [Obba rivulosa]
MSGKMAFAEHATPTDLTIYLFFQIAADHILLPLLVATFLLAPSVKRHATVISVCCAGVIAGIVSSLLFYAGKHIGPEPSKGLCIAQMALIDAVPPMSSVAVLALVFYVWSSFKPSQFHHREKAVLRPAVTASLVCAPYLTFIIFAAVGTHLGLRHSDLVNRDRLYFYCSIKWKPFTDTVGIFTALVCIVATVLECRLLVVLSRNWRALRRAGLGTGIDLQLIVRVCIFTVYILIGTVISLSSIWIGDGVLTNMWAASGGMASFLIFSTQADVFRAWCFWRRPLTRPDTMSSERRLPRAPYPSFDLDLLKRTDSDINEKTRLEALRAYYTSRVQDMGVPIEVISKPEDAFILGQQPRRAWGIDPWAPRNL